MDIIWMDVLVTLKIWNLPSLPSCFRQKSQTLEGIDSLLIEEGEAKALRYHRALCFCHDEVCPTNPPPHNSHQNPAHPILLLDRLSRPQKLARHNSSPSSKPMVL